MVDRALTACHVFTSYMATCAKHIDSTDTALNINLSLKQRSAKMKVNSTRHSAFFSLLHRRLTPHRVSCRVVFAGIGVERASGGGERQVPGLDRAAPGQVL